MAETRAPPPDRASPALRAVLDRSEGAGGKAGLLRDEIVASWERCARAGLRPERFEVPYDADVDDRGRLCWAASGTGKSSCEWSRRRRWRAQPALGRPPPRRLVTDTWPGLERKLARLGYRRHRGTR
jgi:hypothetical protein